jgi:hypothetical protein
MHEGWTKGREAQPEQIKQQRGVAFMPLFFYLRGSSEIF